MYFFFRYKIFRWGRSLIEKESFILIPLSFLWKWGAKLKNVLYDFQFALPEKVSKPVISIGNLVAGGTGKTPLTLLLATEFRKRKVAILTRGYGEIPDEARVLKRRLPHALVFAGKNRVELAKLAIRKGAELILVDDGFQYRKLHRDFDLLVLRGKDPFGKGHFLPRGYLREDPQRISAVDQVFISGHTEDAFPFPFIQTEVETSRILDSFEKEIPSIQGWDVVIFSGIGNPSSFKKTVLALGANILFEELLEDHEPIEALRLDHLFQTAEKLGAKAVLCTEKDFVKISIDKQTKIPLLFLEISLKIVQGEKLWQNLIEKIDQKIDNLG